MNNRDNSTSLFKLTLNQNL